MKSMKFLSMSLLVISCGTAVASDNAPVTWGDSFSNYKTTTTKYVYTDASKTQLAIEGLGVAALGGLVLYKTSTSFKTQADKALVLGKAKFNEVRADNKKIAKAAVITTGVLFTGVALHQGWFGQLWAMMPSFGTKKVVKIEKQEEL
ncbi:hypothetical protein H0X06_06900 [Candidatus Dependentiae bacterium]|nr:hypothetical protein [Candidatus Dependentiae bacterium]